MKLNNRPIRYVYIKVDKHNQNQIQALNNLMTPAVYNPELDLYQVNRNEYVQVPVLSDLPYQEIDEAQEEHDNALIDHTKSIITDENEKIYLSTLTWHDLKIINDPDNKGIFGHDGNNFYIKSSFAQQPKWHKFTTRCTRDDTITATMFKPENSKLKPTPGMYALADAFNIEDPADRAVALADACALCAKESVMKVPGAVTNFVDVIKISNRNKKGLNHYDSLALGKMYWQAHEVYSNAKKVVQKRNDPKLFELADLQAKHLCYQIAGKKLKQPLQKRLSYALQNENSEIALGLVRNAILDYTKGLSLESEGNMFLYESPRFIHSSFDFVKVLYSAIDDANKTRKEPLSENMILTVTNMMELADRQAIRNQLLMNTGINSKRGIAASSFHAAQMGLRNSAYILDAQYQKMNIVRLNSAKLKSEEIPVLNGKLEPLFLCVREDERADFIKNNSEIRVDPTYHALCVENTEANQKKYQKYLPREIPQQSAIKHLDQDHQRSYERAIQVLQEHGFDVSGGIKINPGKGHFTMDKHNKSLGYIVNINDGGIDRIQIKDFNGQYGDKGKFISLMSKEEWNKYHNNFGSLSSEQKAAYAKEEQFRNENREALARTAQVHAAELVKAQVNKSIDLQHDHFYLNKKELSFQDVKGLKADATGELTFKIMSGRTPSGNEHLQYADSIIIPLTNVEGKVMSAQMITNDGQKLFAKGAPMTGNFFTVGGYDKLKTAKCILVAEGVATAASISKLAPEGTVVVAAMNCGNLVDVTKNLAEKFPNAGIGIMSDNDMKSAGIDKINAGISHAYRAKNNLINVRPNVSVVSPPLTKSELKAGLSDFNDAICHHDFDTPERYAERVKLCQNRIFEACELAVINHDLNEEAQVIAVNNYLKYEKSVLAHKKFAQIEVKNEKKEMQVVEEQTSSLSL